MPKGSKVDAAETALEMAARKKGLKGKDLAGYIYGALNNMGFKRGNVSTKAGLEKTTPKGNRPPQSTVMGS